MGTTAEKLQAIINSKEAIRQAIVDKGISCDNTVPLDEYATKIGDISGGSGDLDDFLSGALTSLTSNATSIRRDACRSYTNLISVSLPNITTILAYTFQGCNSLTSVNIPNVTSIGEYAFGNCFVLTSINLQNVTTFTGTNVFQNCKALTSINLPKITSIIINCFMGCELLASVDLGLDAQSIGTNAFYDCVSLTNITIRRTDDICSLNSVQGFPASSTQHITIHVPSDLINSYKNASNWSTLYNNGYITFTALS